MKVLHVVTKSELGGAQTHVWQLATHLQRKGHAVHITASPGGWLQDQAQRHDIPFHPNLSLSNSPNPLKGLRAGRQTAGLAARIRPDVIHCHSSAAGFWTRLAVRGSTPTVFTAHGWGFMPGVPLLRRVALLVAEKLVARFTARYICVSERDGLLAMRYGIAPTGRVSVIHNGVEPAGTGRKRCREGSLRAISVGRLARPKEPELLLAALSEMPAGLREVYELRIVGEGPLLPALRKRVAHNGVNAKLVGALDRDEVLRMLSESDVFILASRYEGFPISILEAMSVGLAVIASDVGGVREAVTPECGILVPSSDKEALKQALIRLAENPGAVERYGAAARDRVGREFSLAGMCEKTMAVYEGVRAQCL